jgi:hypothetical protein
MEREISLIERENALSRAKFPVTTRANRSFSEGWRTV